jgi:hypothetical protein
MVLDDVRLHSEIASASGAAWACGKLAQRVPREEPMLDLRRRQLITLARRGGGVAA